MNPPSRWPQHVLKQAIRTGAGTSPVRPVPSSRGGSPLWIVQRPDWEIQPTVMKRGEDRLFEEGFADTQNRMEALSVALSEGDPKG